VSRRESWVERCLALILTTCAVIITGMVVRREISSPGRRPATAVPRYVSDWQAYFSGGKQLGVPGGEVKIVEFADFQCPYCARFAKSLDSLMMLFPSEVQVIVRSFPLSIHSHSMTAALAAECASEQRAFERFYRAVFEQPDSLWALGAGAIAVATAVPDTDQFQGCLSNPETVKRVMADSAAGVRLELGGTPLVLVNGWEFTDTPSTADMADLIRAKRLVR